MNQYYVVAQCDSGICVCSLLWILYLTWVWVASGTPRSHPLLFRYSDQFVHVHIMGKRNGRLYYVLKLMSAHTVTGHHIFIECLWQLCYIRICNLLNLCRWSVYPWLTFFNLCTDVYTYRKQGKGKNGKDRMVGIAVLIIIRRCILWEDCPASAT